MKQQQDYKVVFKKPLFFFIIQWFFKEAHWEDGIIIAFGDTIYTKFPIEEESLLEHEKTHLSQHEYSKLKAVWWWVKYLFSTQFRFEQELEAHYWEYFTFCQIRRDKQAQVQMLRLLGKRLASELYGNMVSVSKATDLIRNYLNIKR